MKSSKRLAWSPNDFRVKFTVSKQDGFNIQIYLLLLCSKIFCKHLSPPSKQAIFITLTSPPQQPFSRVEERLKSCLPWLGATESTGGGTHGLSQASTTINWAHRDTGLPAPSQCFPLMAQWSQRQSNPHLLRLASLSLRLTLSPEQSPQLLIQCSSVSPLHIASSLFSIPYHCKLKTLKYNHLHSKPVYHSLVVMCNLV